MRGSGDGRGPSAGKTLVSFSTSRTAHIVGGSLCSRTEVLFVVALKNATGVHAHTDTP